MILAPHPLPRKLDRYRVGVLDFEMRTGPWGPASVSEVGLVVAEGGRMSYRFSGFVSTSTSDLEQLAVILRWHLYGCDYLAGYGPLELAVLRQLLRGPIGGRYIDVLEAARWTRPDLSDHSLGTVCRALGIAPTNRHRALPDAEAAFACLLALMIGNRVSANHAG